MKRLSIFVALISLFGLLTMPTAWACRGRGSPIAFASRIMVGSRWVGWGWGVYTPRIYDPNTVTTITGTVVAIDPQLSSQGMPRGMGGGVHLKVETAEGIFAVHLGPSGYLDDQALQLVVGDEIQVMGSQVTLADTPTIIAAEVHKGDQVLILRNSAGVPVWSGGRYP